MSEVTDGNETVSEDLDTFSAEFFGSAKPVEEVEVVEEVEDTTEEVEAEEGETPEAEDTEEEDAEEESEDEPEVEEPKKVRKTAKDRIQELANERRQERDARIAAETRLADLEAKLAKSQEKDSTAAPQKAATAQEAPDPDATDDAGELLYPLGEFDPKYVADLTKHLFRQEAEAAKAEAAKEAETKKAEAEYNERVGNWETKLSETEEALPDLRDKLVTLDTTFSNLDPQYGNYLAEAIMGMERGPEVLYYLADNLDEAQKIVASGPVAAIIALGRLEGIMTSPAEKRNEKRVSKAPTPPTSTKGVGVAKGPSGDTDDLDAFEREFFRRK
jgi:hypothetical protein